MWQRIPFCTNRRLIYGASFTEAVYPEIPSKDGCYGQWDTTDLTGLHFDTIVTATYEPYITTLASDIQRDDHTAVFVEGLFRDGDCLYADEISNLSTAPKHTIEAWDLQIPEDGQASHTVRWMIPDDSESTYAVYTLQENGWKKVCSEQIGTCLCFEMTGTEQFSVVPTGHTAWWVWLLPGIGCAGAAVVVLLLAHKRKINQ